MSKCSSITYRYMHLRCSCPLRLTVQTFHRNRYTVLYLLFILKYIHEIRKYRTEITSHVATATINSYMSHICVPLCMVLNLYFRGTYLSTYSVLYLTTHTHTHMYVYKVLVRIAWMAAVMCGCVIVLIVKMILAKTFATDLFEFVYSSMST